MAGCSTPQQVDALRQLITHWKSVDHMIPAQQENIDEYTKLFELQVKGGRVKASCPLISHTNDGGNGGGGMTLLCRLISGAARDGARRAARPTARALGKSPRTL